MNFDRQQRNVTIISSPTSPGSAWIRFQKSVYPAPGFNADLAIKAIEKRGTTHLIGTPTMFNDIVNSPIRKNHDISSLSYAIVGGSPATPALVRLVFKSFLCT